jgi:hypothetical protein
MKFQEVAVTNVISYIQHTCIVEVLMICLCNFDSMCRVTRSS